MMEVDSTVDALYKKPSTRAPSIELDEQMTDIDSILRNGDASPENESRHLKDKNVDEAGEF